MIEIRAPRPQELPILVRQCADIPGGDARDLAWFEAREHRVLLDDGVVIGHTSWTQHDGYVTWDETYIAPTHRTLGLGRRLMEARAAQTPGLVFGACKPDNEPMVHLLTTIGFHPCQTVPQGFSDGDAVLWARGHGF